MAWFGARSFVKNGPHYEERVTLWERASFAEAMVAAEDEAADYVSVFEEAVALDLFQAFELADPPGEGRECWSLIRGSDLEPDAYLSRFFDTGTEIMGKLVEDESPPQVEADRPEQRSLVIADEVETYGVLLKSGHEVVVRAHDSEVRGDSWLFVLHSEVPVREHLVARFPVDLVESVVGGFDDFADNGS